MKLRLMQIFDIPQIRKLPQSVQSCILPDAISDFVEIQPQQKIKLLQEKLTKVLKSEYCNMPDFMKLIPSGATEEETVKYLQKMFEDSKFFSRVSLCERFYGKNFEFARLAGAVSEEATISIYKGKSFKKVLKQIAKGYSKEYKIKSRTIQRAGDSGQYRGRYRLNVERCDDMLWTEYGPSSDFDFGYKEYIKRLDDSYGELVSPYKNFKLSTIYPDSRTIDHPMHGEVPGNMKIISERYKIFQSLLQDYKKTGKLTPKQIAKADDIISEIYYLMANTCPFLSGTNGICDILMRSQYKALGINKPHIKKGVGLDFEAFCRNLDDYKLKWNSFFEN